MGSKFADTHDYTFSNFCNTYKVFSIPPFQRAYAWGNKQINDLWESLVANESEYFIGNIVCLSPSEETDGRLVVIDGQQRLFTISMILTVLRDECKFIKAKTKEDKEKLRIFKDNINNHLFNTDLSKPFEKALRLLHAKNNLRDIYEKLVKGKLDLSDKYEISFLDDNQIKYVKNYKTIQRLVKNYTKGDIEKNIELLEKVRTLLFIVIVCNSDSDAYHIFEGLNATGIGLSVADLVKNAILQAVKKSDSKEIVEDNWEEIESIFEETKISLFPKFLRHQWISKEGYINTSKLFDSIKKTKLSKKESSKIDDYTREILNDAKIYAGLRFQEKESYLLKNKKIDSDVLGIVQNFRVLDVDQAYELLLAYFNKYIENAHYTKKQLISDLKALWTFCFRAKIMNVNPSEYERKFAEQCKFVNNYSKKETDRMGVKFYQELRKIVVNNKEFKENFIIDIRYKEGSDNGLIKLLLQEIMCYKQKPPIAFQAPSIEHILPRDPSKWGLKKSEIKDFVHEIGNLTLLDEQDNHSLGNETIATKVEKVYKVSPFKMNSDIAQLELDFIKNPSITIRKRSNFLVNIVTKIWKM